MEERLRYRDNIRIQELASTIAEDFAQMRRDCDLKPNEMGPGWYGWVSAREVEELVTLLREEA